MRRIEDIKLIGAYTRAAKNGAVTGFSQNIDTLGCEDVLISIATSSVATGTATKFYFYHASGSTTKAASGTAFGTNPSLTTAATASQRHAILIEGQQSRKRYLIILASKLTTSHGFNWTVLGFQNKSIPSTSTLGSYTSVVKAAV